MRAAAGILYLAVLYAPWAAQAQIYMCKDASGRTITSDRLVPECADREVREYGRNGVLTRVIPPPLTAEQKRQRELEEQRKKTEAAAAEEQRKSDRAMLERFQNENAIEVARKRALDPLREQVKRENATLAEVEKDARQAQAEIEAYRKKNTKPPADLNRRFDDTAKNVANVKKRLQDYDAEIARINAKFDQTLKRYRELMGSAAATGQ